LYGSSAKANYQNGWDIDLTQNGIELDLTALHQMEDQLDDVLLPFKIDSHLLDLIENSFLLGHIHRVVKLFYKSGKRVVYPRKTFF
jgi:hypothetical protein